MRRVLAASLCVVLSVLAAALALRSGTGPSSTEDAASVTEESTAAGWSVRRVPGPVVDGVAALALRADLAVATGGAEACVVVHGPGGRIVDLDGSVPLAPGSTIKILTAIGAVVNLPEQFRFITTVEALGPVDGPSVPGVALVGGGDPLLGTPEWIAARQEDPMLAGTPTTPMATLADAVVEAGIESIPQGVMGVAPRWSDEPSFLPDWEESYRDNAVGPVTSLTVNGGFRAPGQPVADAPLFAAEELTRLLRERGVEVGAPSTARETAGGEILGAVQSTTLPEIVAQMLATSDNLTAEVLVREIAASSGATSTAQGVAIIREDLEQLGLPVEGLDQRDGSGLARESRAPCALLDAALALHEPPELVAVRAGLSVAGEVGTLAPRFVGSALTGRLEAKTGTLPGVSALAGFMEVGPPLRFAFVANGEFSEAAAIPLREGVAEIIARYPDAPPPDRLVPAP